MAHTRTPGRLWVTGAVFAALLLATQVARAQEKVHSGWDLLATQPGTFLDATPLGWGFIPLQGVPLGSFNFGGSIGVRTDLFNTDTIVQRKADATSGSPTIPIELVALQLTSVNPIPALGNQHLFVTLQSRRAPHESPQNPSTGQMTINGLDDPNPTNDTFNSFFDVFFDFRTGALNGPIVGSGSGTMIATGVPWSHDAPPLAVKIEGVNHKLNGIDTSQDFWPGAGGRFQETHIAFSMVHVVQTATVPEPTSMLLFGAGLGTVVAGRLRRRKR